MSEGQFPSKSDVVGWANKLYSEGVDHRDAKAYAAVFAEDGWVQFGNNPPLVGAAAIEPAIANFFTVMDTVSHKEIATTYCDGVLTLEAEVTYTVRGKTVTVPAASVYVMVRNTTPMAQICRIYVDLTPLFAAAAS